MRFAVLLLLATACGGRVAQDTDAGALPEGDDAGESNDARQPATPNTNVGVCPADPPVPDSSCAMFSDQGCVYTVKEHSVWTCQPFVCDSSGHWRSLGSGC